MGEQLSISEQLTETPTIGDEVIRSYMLRYLEPLKGRRISGGIAVVDLPDSSKRIAFVNGNVKWVFEGNCRDKQDGYIPSWLVGPNFSTEEVVICTDEVGGNPIKEAYWGKLSDIAGSNLHLSRGARFLRDSASRYEVSLLRIGKDPWGERLLSLSFSPRIGGESGVVLDVFLGHGNFYFDKRGQYMLEDTVEVVTGYGKVSFKGRDFSDLRMKTVEVFSHSFNRNILIDGERKSLRKSVKSAIHDSWIDAVVGHVEIVNGKVAVDDTTHWGRMALGIMRHRVIS